MPNVRYYDYGVMRREADRRMYDAQRRTGRQNADSAARGRPTENRSAPSPDICPAACVREGHEPPECPACAESCTQAGSRTESECCARSASPALRLPSEELLILALILLVMSEGGNLPLVLALLYLLM